MRTLRFFLRARYGVNLAILLIALVTKALVPAGMMIASDRSLSLTVSFCTGMGAVEQRTINVERNASPIGDHDAGDGYQGCAFTALTHAGTNGPDPVLLLGTLVFIVAGGTAAMVATGTPSLRFQRPPPRGPPAFW